MELTWVEYLKVITKDTIIVKTSNVKVIWAYSIFVHTVNYRRKKFKRDRLQAAML
jgi:hypothetical protein